LLLYLYNRDTRAEMTEKKEKVIAKRLRWGMRPNGSQAMQQGHMPLNFILHFSW